MLLTSLSLRYFIGEEDTGHVVEEYVFVFFMCFLIQRTRWSKARQARFHLQGQVS